MDNTFSISSLFQNHPQNIVRSHPFSIVRSHPFSIVRSHPFSIVRSHPFSIVRSHPFSIVRLIVSPSRDYFLHSSPLSIPAFHNGSKRSRFRKSCTRRSGT